MQPVGASPAGCHPQFCCIAGCARYPCLGTAARRRPSAQVRYPQVLCCVCSSNCFLDLEVDNDDDNCILFRRLDIIMFVHFAFSYVPPFRLNILYLCFRPPPSPRLPPSTWGTCPACVGSGTLFSFCCLPGPKQ